jgi:hypothetical protein
VFNDSDMRVPIAESSRQAVCCYGIGVMWYVFAKPDVDCKGRLNDSDSRLNSCNKSQRDALFHKFILLKNSTCFGQIYCPSSGVSTLYTQKLVCVMLVMLTVC